LEVTIFAGDVNRSAEFYQAVGVELFEDEDLSHLRNFEGVIGNTTMQVFQSNERHPVSHVVLGFRVSDVAAAASRLQHLGFDWHCPLPNYVITQDPDGNTVSLVQAEPVTALAD
jgi:predicted enzyme related to lactoylglutathione lyase